MRKNLDRLVKVGAIQVLPPPRPGSPGYYSVDPNSAFWRFAWELCERAQV